ncbi:TPA: hypothetical protein ENX78_00255 [Candidatus Poribacteria bacterium]|nr:hypothetical protein [Candidatus Poribacteria bacterium]
MFKKIRDLLIFVLIVSLAFSTFVGCGSDNDNGDNATPPALPPDSSMSMDLTAFGGGKMAPSSQAPGKNFSNAAVRVLLLDTAIIVAFLPATVVFKAAKSVEPVKQDDGSWLWSYKTVFLGQNYEANLTASLEPDKVIWTMKVTNPAFKPPLKDFQWYVGESALNNSYGNWRFFDHTTPNEANEIARIDWTVKSLTKGELIFSSEDKKSQIYGDKVTYSLDGTTALITYFDASENMTAEVTWDTATTAGGLKVPGYNNGEWAYWDENKQDVVK